VKPRTTRELELIVRIQVDDDQPEYCGPGCQYLETPGYCRFFHERNHQGKRLGACREFDVGRIFRASTIDVDVPDGFGDWRQRKLAIRKAKQYAEVKQAKLLGVTKTKTRCTYFDGNVWQVSLKWRVAKKRAEKD
jgi:hypothetical protein